MLPKRVRPLILSFYVPELLFSTGWGLILPVLPRLATTLTGSIAGAAAITALVAVGTLLIDIPAGIIADRLRQRTMVTALLLMIVVAAFLASIANGVLLLATATLLLGVCRGAWFVMRMNFTRHSVVPEERGRALATLGGMNRIGAYAIGPSLGGFLAGTMGIRTPFIVVILLMIVAIVISMKWVPNRVAQKTKITQDNQNNPLLNFARHSVVPEERGRGAWLILRTVLLDHWRIFLRTGPAMLTLNLIRAGRLLLLPLWGQWIGLSVTEVGIAMSVSGITDMLLFYPTGIIMDRLGRRYAAAASILLMSASLALMPLTKSFPNLLLVAGLAGIGNGLGSGVSMTIGSDLSPQRGSGEFIGIWRLIGDMGHTAGPAAISLITATLALSLAGPILSLLGVCGASLFIFVVKETKQRP